MSDKDETQTSRRARRRAEREKAEAEEREVDEAAADEGEAESAEEEEGADEEAGADDDAAESPEGGEASAGGSEGEEEAPRAPNRAERRAAKKKKKSDAEAASAADIRDRNARLREKAAARRREKRDREAAVARGLDASEMVDDALARATHNVTSFIRKHFNIVQWVIVLGIAGGIGYNIWSWRHEKSLGKASDELMQAVHAEQGRVGASPDAKLGMEDPRPTFDTDEARLKKADEEYRQALELRTGSGTAILAKLGLAGVLFDQGKYDDAIAKYEDVKSSELAKHDADVRMRAIEGIGLSREAKGDNDGALKIFKELESSEVSGFKGLGLLHQARVLLTKGDKEKAKELAKAAQEQATKDRSPYQMAGYLDGAAREIIAAIDPSTVPPSTTPGYTQEQIDALRKQIEQDPTKLQKMLENLGKSVPKIPDVQMPPIEPPPGPPESP